LIGTSSVFHLWWRSHVVSRR